MKLQKTLIFLVILLVLIGILYYDKLRMGEKTKRVELEKKIIPIPQEDINKIVIKNNDFQAELKKEDNEWKLVKPISTKADNDAISSLLTTIANGTRKKTLESVADKLGEFGFSDKSNYIEFGSDKTGSPIKLIFGNKTPVPFEVYGRLNNERSVFVIDEMVKNAINKSVYDLRDKTIIAIVPEDVKTMKLISSAGEIVCEQEERDRIWQIKKPAEYKGDKTKIEDIIRKINSSKVKEFVEPLREKKEEATEVTQKQIDLSEYGLDNPMITVELTKKDNSQHQLLLGKIDEKTKNYYAKIGASEQIFEVEEGLINELSAGLTKLRDKTLFDFDVDKVERLVVKSAKGLIDAKKKDEKWLLTSLNDKEVRDYKISDMLYEIKRLKVEDFTNKKINEIENPGLNPPVVEIQVYSSPSEEESKEKKVISATLKIGNIAPDPSKAYAEFDKIDEVVLLNKDVLDKLNKNSEDVLDKRIIKFEPTNVQRLDITLKDKEIKLQKEDSKWIMISENNKKAQTTKVMDVLWKLKDFEYMAEYDKELTDKFEDYCTITVFESEGKEVVGLNLKVNKDNSDEVIAIVKDEKYRVAPTIKNDIPQNVDFFFDSK